MGDDPLPAIPQICHTWRLAYARQGLFANYFLSSLVQFLAFPSQLSPCVVLIDLGHRHRGLFRSAQSMAQLPGGMKDHSLDSVFTSRRSRLPAAQ